jgi:FAD/FMN-containing dehydrogenase
VPHTAALQITDRAARLPEFKGTALPYGSGRSYGDSCLNGGGTLLRTNTLDRFLAFDRNRGELCCEAGTRLDTILDLIVPQGWFLPVTPGTSQVTVGGAIANDVHGKNHRLAGSFGDHLIEFELLRSDGERRRVRPGDAEGWFAATVGGLGLTGLITWARLRLRPIRSPLMACETTRFGHLDEFFALSRTRGARAEHAVAWIDCLARGAALGRGHFITADHAGAMPDPPNAPRHRLNVPLTPPISLINRLTLRPFNALYFRRRPAGTRCAIEHYRRYFYPLDSIRQWNRIYGPRGFLQYQCVIPPTQAPAAIAALMREISASGCGSFLAVLKEFGERRATGLMSFPRPGTTLALDFPNGGPSLLTLLSRLDAIVIETGGAIYPAKDARMSPSCFRAGFPEWETFSRYVDPRFSSSFWRRMAEAPCNV